MMVNIAAIGSRDCLESLAYAARFEITDDLTMLAGVVVGIDQRAIVEWRVKPAYRELVSSV